MEFRQLQYVLKTAMYLHFTRAADELGITQPSLSQQIDKLEKELDVKLFERKTRSVKLTLAGEEFVLRANKVVAELEQLSAAMRKHSFSKKWSIRIGILSNLGYLNFPRKFLQFQQEYANINIHVMEKAGSNELLNLLHEGSIDAAFLISTKDYYCDAKVTCHTLIPGTINLVARKDHPIIGRNTIFWGDIAKENFIFPNRTHSMYNALLSACKTAGFNPKIVSECDQIDTILGLVSQGFGIAFISSQIAASVSHSNVAILPVKPFISRDISLVYLANSTHSSSLKAFRDFILRINYKKDILEANGFTHSGKIF